jgi:RNA polymerase sigma-70 factor, ECF subfamily
MTAQCSETYHASGTSAAPAKRPTDSSEEYAFLAAAKRGDSAAFELLCKQSAKMVFRVARRMMRNNEDAEDVLQESFQQAFIHLNSFNGDSRFSTWLSRIAINAALMKLRKKQHLWDVSLDESTEDEQSSHRLDVEYQGLNPEELYAQTERQQILAEAMNELAPGTRKAIELREIDERSGEETAQIMGISVSAVKARVFHGRRKLRERLTRIAEPAWRSARKTSRRMGGTTHISLDQMTCNACD